MTHLSDEFLLAYLDGQLEKGQASEVSRLAGANAEISRRVGRLKRTQDQLIETFSAFAREDVSLPHPSTFFNEATAPQKSASAPAAKVAEQKRPRAPKQVLFVAAVFAGGLLGGYGATFLRAQPRQLPPKDMDRPPAALISPTSWSNDIVRFHSYFPKETLTPYPDAIANPDLIRFQLSKITAKAITPPDFGRHGFTLYRGQTFNYRQDRMMQLTYSSKTEAPLTLYVLPAAELSDKGAEGQSLGSNKAVSWVSDRVRFLLTGEKSEEDLKVLAALAQSQIPRKP
jgi:anti-sigma factor RsiW